MEKISWIKFIVGVISIGVGIVFLVSFIMNPIDKERDTNKHNLQGIVYGTLAIVFGVSLIINSFN